MKILLVHNHYGSAAPSGENEVFRREKTLLESHSHEVCVFERHSDEILLAGRLGLIHGALAAPWNPRSARRMRRIMAGFRPDVVHAHNTFPLISPSIFSAARGAARVLTLHNYRLFCAAGIPMRDGQVCTICLDRRSALPAMRYGCYRDSRLATLPLALSVSLHRTRGTWHRDVEAFIALSEFQRRIMVASGLPPERVSVKPNFFPGNPQLVPWTDRVPRVVYVGRLSQEKGVDDLVAAWLSWGTSAPELVLVGDGPLRGSVMSRIREAGVNNITLTGQVSATDAQRWIATSRLLALPSRCFEGFPLTLSEAYAFGTPILASDLGPLPDLVTPTGSGDVFRSGDRNELESAAKRLWSNEQRLAAMSANARQCFESGMSEEINYRALIDVYQRALSAIERNQGRRQNASAAD